MRADRNAIAFRIPRVRREIGSRFDGGAGRFERPLELDPMRGRHTERQEKWASSDAFDPTRSFRGGFDHQDRAAEIEPDRSQRTVAPMVPRDFVQTEHVSVERRDSLDVARTECEMMEATIHGTL